GGLTRSLTRETVADGTSTEEEEVIKLQVGILSEGRIGAVGHLKIMHFKTDAHGLGALGVHCTLIPPRLIKAPTAVILPGVRDLVIGIKIGTQWRNHAGGVDATFVALGFQIITTGLNEDPEVSAGLNSLAVGEALGNIFEATIGPDDHEVIRADTGGREISRIATTYFEGLIRRRLKLAFVSGRISPFEAQVQREFPPWITTTRRERNVFPIQIVIVKGLHGVIAIEDHTVTFVSSGRRIEDAVVVLINPDPHTIVGKVGGQRTAFE